MNFEFNYFFDLLPRTPASLLPPANTTQAHNCDFAYGELRATRSDQYIKPLVNAARSVYTDSGLTFYTWLDDVNATRSPLANDPFDRLYYTTQYVTTSNGMRANGGEPSTSYRVGVPRPTTAPVLTNANSSPLNNALLTATFHYEFAGVKYQEQVINLTSITVLEKWTFTPPTLHYTPPTRNPETGEFSRPDPFETPAIATLVVRLTGKKPSSGNIVLDVYTSNSLHSTLLNTERIWLFATTKIGNAGDYTITLSSVEDESTRETCAYAYTYVNTYGEESPPIGADTADYFYHGSIAVLGQSGTQFDFLEHSGSSLNEMLASLDSYPPAHFDGVCWQRQLLDSSWRGGEQLSR